MLELNNKPLFPGIYMPIQLHRNDKLVKVIADIKRSGWVTATHARVQ